MPAAAARARSVVGLYGDPTVAWSILLRARLREPVAAAEVADRLTRLTERRPALGPAPQVVTLSTSDIDGTAERFASAPYTGGAPLLRVAVGEHEPVLLIAAHHGVVDGLGLLALLGAALDTPVSSNANGLADRTATESFAHSAARRLGEALFAPPTRIRPSTSDSGDPAAPDVLVAHDGPLLSAGSAALTAAAAAATTAWNHAHGAAADRVVAAVGASRRCGEDLHPVHDSAFLRLRLRPGATTADTARLLSSQPPEPDFPAHHNPLASLGIRLLAPRLGSTFLTSNLGVVHAGDAVRALAFHPAASGRSGVAFGAATVNGTTTVTIRARRCDFDHPAATHLLTRTLAALSTPTP